MYDNTNKTKERDGIGIVEDDKQWERTLSAFKFQQEKQGGRVQERLKIINIGKGL